MTEHHLPEIDLERAQAFAAAFRANRAKAKKQSARHRNALGAVRIAFLLALLAGASFYIIRFSPLLAGGKINYGFILKSAEESKTENVTEKSDIRQTDVVIAPGAREVKRTAKARTAPAARVSAVKPVKLDKQPLETASASAARRHTAVRAPALKPETPVAVEPAKVAKTETMKTEPAKTASAASPTKIDWKNTEITGEIPGAYLVIYQQRQVLGICVKSEYVRVYYNVTLPGELKPGDYRFKQRKGDIRRIELDNGMEILPDAGNGEEAIVLKAGEMDELWLATGGKTTVMVRP